MTAIGDYEFQELSFGPFQWYPEGSGMVGQEQGSVTVTASEGKRILAFTSQRDHGDSGGFTSVSQPVLSNDGTELFYTYSLAYDTHEAYLLVQLASARMGTCDV